MNFVALVIRLQLTLNQPFTEKQTYMSGSGLIIMKKEFLINITSNLRTRVITWNSYDQ